MLPKLTGFRRFITGRGFNFDAGPNSQTIPKPGSRVAVVAADA